MLPLRHGFCAVNQPSFSAQRGRVVGPTLLRGAWAHSLAANGLRASPLPFIVFAQRVGLTLEEIGEELAKLPADRIPTRRDWARLSGKWTKRIDKRIAELKRLRAGLTQCIGCGCLSIDKCELANPADRAGRKGPGPRYWLG